MNILIIPTLGYSFIENCLDFMIKVNLNCEKLPLAHF